ncbi:MAG TPA: YegP family protein [Terrimicrobiaceae bacterium]
MPTTARNGYQIWKSNRDGEWYWHFKAKNGELVASGEGYKNKSDCLHAIDLLRASAKDKVWNLTPEG